MPAAALIPLSIASDLTLPCLPPPITIHDYVPIPPAPAPPICMAIESPVAVMWGPGFALFQNKLTTTVIHMGLPFALDGHDCGYMIPHLTVPINNARLPMIIMFSSRKAVFSSSTVKANGAQIGCTTLLLFPMMCCAYPITLPTGFPGGNTLNTCKVGLTAADIFAGVVTMLLTIAGDVWTLEAPQAPTVSDFLSKALLGEENLPTWLKKQAVGVLAGLARIAITDEGSVQLQVGSSYFGGTVGYSRQSDGTWSVGGAVQGGVPLLPGVGPIVAGQGQIQYTRNPDGSTSLVRSSSVAAGGGAGPLVSGGTSGTSATTTTTDASGKQATTESKSSQSVGVVPLHGAAKQTNASGPAGPTPPKNGYYGGQSNGKPWGAPL